MLITPFYILYIHNCQSDREYAYSSPFNGFFTILKKKVIFH